MGSLSYSISTSLDGYVNDANGSIEFSVPTEEEHAFFNEQERRVDTYLFGRRMYETMQVWETLDDDADVMREYQDIWRGIDKIVYSTTIDKVTTARTRLERSFDADAVRALKADRAVSIGGPNLAAHALRADLVDDVYQFVRPVILGGGTPWLPHDGHHVDLQLVTERRFASGLVFLHYRIASDR
jgi:dihydrofolate reductase